MSFDWDAPAYDDVNNEAHAHWLAERPPPDLPSLDDEPAPNIGTRGDQGPDPWAHGQIECERCSELREPACTHGRALCSEHAALCCQSCACEEADALAIIQQQQDEWWGRA